MKKALLSITAILVFATLAQSQEDGPKLAKSASKALTSYNIDPVGNVAKLEEARTKIDQALKTPEAQALVSAWQTKGEIYNTITAKDMAKRMVAANSPLSHDNSALEAFDAFKKAYEMAQKKFEKSDAIKGIMDNLQGSLVNIGAMKYEEKAFDKAYASFKAALESHDILNKAGEKSIFDDKAQYENQVYYTAVCAIQAQKTAEALPFLEKLHQSGNAKPEIYEILYNAKVETGDNAAAEKILAEGRQKYPDDAGLLFAEINVYLKAGKLNELTDRLKKAIEKEPNNVGLYVTLGNVYDNLYTRSLEAKNDADATKYFDEAKKQYAQAIAKDPKNVDATYSLGALYYNKAAIRTKEMNAMPEDYSAAGLKKFETMKNEVMALFDEALPYFQKAESLNPNDVNTLIALKEIYTRKEDDLALEFKKRLDNAASGTKNETSHFKN